MNLLPNALFVEQSDVKTLVSVLLGRVDVVHNALRLLLKYIGQNRVDVKADLLLLFWLVGRVNQTDYVAVFQVLEVSSCRLNLSPEAVRLTVAYLSTGANALLAE